MWDKLNPPRLTLDKTGLDWVKGGLTNNLSTTIFIYNFFIIITILNYSLYIIFSL